MNTLDTIAVYGKYKIGGTYVKISTTWWNIIHSFVTPAKYIFYFFVLGLPNL